MVGGFILKQSNFSKMNMASNLTENVGTGKRFRVNPNNPITRSRENMKRKIARQVNETGATAEEVALGYINQNRGDIDRFVISKGEQPLQNPVELCVQALALREQDVAQVQKTTGLPRIQAELYLDGMEEDAMQNNSAEADNFIGPILGAIGAVAQKGIEKIRAKRKEKGKPTKFWDFLSNASGNTPGMATEAAENTNYPINVMGADIINEIKEREKKKEIQKMLPLIIGGVVVLILITILITKGASKNK